MTTYITQEQALKLAKKLHAATKTDYQAYANAVIQHYKDSQPESYNMMSWNAGFAEARRIDKNKELDRIAQDSQPKPASVEEIMELADRYSHARDMLNVDVDEYRLELSQAITQQAEALAQALTENSNLNSELTAALENWGHMQEECKKLRTQLAVDIKYTIAMQRAIEIHCDGKPVPFAVADQCPHHAEMLNKNLAALQYNGELPEAVAYLPVSVHGAVGEPITVEQHKDMQDPNCFGEHWGGDRPLYTADQVRQAIANDRAKQLKGIFAVQVAAGKWRSLNDEGYTTNYVSFSKDGRTGQINPYGQVTWGELDALAEQVPQWLPIASAPKSKVTKPEHHLLLWVEGKGPAFGYVFDDGIGGILPSAEGYSDRWSVTHWMPIPAAPSPKEAL